MNHLSKKTGWITPLFCCAQALLYVLILTTEGAILQYTSFGAILLCFIHALLYWQDGNRWVIGGLLCTVVADFFLVLCSPIQRLAGMVCFLIAQTLYAVTIHSTNKRKQLLFIRFGLILISELITIFVLKDKTDALALISMAYYANLITNILCLVSPTRPLPLTAFILFLLCDTVIGLQVACGAYLPISDGSLLYRILFCDFNLSWAFYLPSQVLLSLWAKQS